jgi:hypothetical protein
VPSSNFLISSKIIADCPDKGKPVRISLIMFKKEVGDDLNTKPRTKLYQHTVLTAFNKSWPELYSTEIAKISQKDCSDWAARYGKDYSIT